MENNKKIPFLGNYIDGNWTQSDGGGNEWAIVSPADLRDTIIEIKSSVHDVAAACEAAKQAFKTWKNTTLDERKEYLSKLKQVYTARADEMAIMISRETGKPLWESKTEASALAAKISVTLDYSLKLISEEKIPGALPNIDGYVRYKPRGVMAVVGPFNFPAHLPNGHIVPALIAGNTIVFKPSDKTPAVGQLLAEFFAEAGFPPGVFNLVQGQAEIGKRLVQSEHVDGVLFTGSYEVGLKIKQDTLDHYWKILALEMGGKNSTIVWDDADLEKAVYETIVGAYMTSGQRCSCTSRVVLHKNIKDKFVENFHATAKKLSVDHWSKNPFMGPLISQDSVEKYMRFQEIAGREGAESLMRGKSLDVGVEGYYVSPSIHLVGKLNKESTYQKNEIFGPNVAIYTVEEPEEAFEIVNFGGYGLAAALFSKDKQLFDHFLAETRVGLFNWNRTTNGASSKMPFGGLGKSGNDRPSGHFAVQYCATPVASLEDETEFDKNKMFPGISYDYT
ncbi:MAG: succinylglutamate-semialdehyde dehydrogenase [Bdellovibrionales bacterium]|nr:succinylglutamate-semialdehyde dehydrogenase [Bdellovibrionales bacterium]